MAEAKDKPLTRQEALEVPLDKREAEAEKAYSKYFERTRSQLGLTLRAASTTPYGQQVLAPLNLNPETMTYSDFASKVPIIKPRDVAENPGHFAAGNLAEMYSRKSGGTTGKPKQFYFPEADLNVSVGPITRAAIEKSTNPVLIHGDWASIDFDVIERSLRALRPDIKIGLYQRVGEAIEHIKPADTVFLESEVTNFRAFMYYLNEALDNNPPLSQALKGKKFLIELNSEPVHADELALWSSRLEEIFGIEPDIFVLYGQNDTGNLGLYDYAKGHTEADIKYAVEENRFLEVLDPQGKPLIGGKGDVVITTFRDNGSIFFRYLSGDEGSLTIDEDGRAYISGVERKPEDGMISLWGCKLFVPGLLDKIREQTGIPVRLEAQAFEDPNSLGQVLNIQVYSDDFSNSDRSQEAVNKVTKILDEADEYSFLPSFIESGMLKINVIASAEPPKGFVKGWRVLPTEKLPI